MTAKDALQSVAQKLEQAGITEPQAKAKVIISHALGIGLGEIYAFGEVSVQAMGGIDAMMQRCIAGEPVEYVTGKAHFRHIVLDVGRDVLIPRQETELVVQAAIGLITENGYKTALDMCCGSGCIAISLAAETQATVDAADISEAALAVATRNAAANGASNIRFFQSDMFTGVNAAYDIIVCNPPYVSNAEYNALDSSVKDYEPRCALVAGDGLDFYRVIVQQSGQYMHSGGALVVEIGITQGEDVAAMLAQGGFTDIQIFKDYTARDRIVTARKV